MPGSKRKIDEDTWIVSQSKKFKQGFLLSTVYETTLAHLRLGARQFYNSIVQPNGGGDAETDAGSVHSSPGASPVQHRTRTTPSSPYNTPPGSPVVRDVISENELSIGPALIPRPVVVCQECVLRTQRPTGSEDLYGKCAYCDKLACHLNECRRCSSGFCRECCLAKYDDATEAYECIGCLR